MLRSISVLLLFCGVILGGTVGLRSPSRFGLWQIWPHGRRHGTYKARGELYIEGNASALRVTGWHLDLRLKNFTSKKKRRFKKNELDTNFNHSTLLIFGEDKIIPLFDTTFINSIAFWGMVALNSPPKRRRLLPTTPGIYHVIWFFCLAKNSLEIKVTSCWVELFALFLPQNWYCLGTNPQIIGHFSH